MPVHCLDESTVSTGFLVLALLCIAAMAVVVFTGLFGRGVRYKVASPGPESLDSEAFLYMLEALTDSKINRATMLEVLTNGETFYRAELDAIRAAQGTINLEAYIFERGEIAHRLVELLTERVRAGVRVNLLLDAVGSAGTNKSSFATFTEAGGRLAWYHDFRLSNLVRFNNRTHRELLIVDGRIGFIGGAGIADHWLKGNKGHPFHRGDLAKRVLNVLTERARNGVRVTLTIDAIGSSITPKSYFDDLRKAGGRVQWYHKVRWNTWMRSNNRTHREILTIDGQVGFVGGAGYDDQWVYSKKAGEPRWRDTMFRVEGDVVLGLQSAVVQNWLEASGEILDGPDYFPSATNAGSTPALVIASTPTTSGATRARILFQVLLSAARKSIDITTPYFVPDSSARNELVRAMRERHVTVRILVPGPKNDHPSIRHTSRSMYGDLLRAGAHIYEYTPTMLHAKIMVVDGAWVLVGSTNFDPRSFGIDEEGNLAALDPPLAQTLTAEFDNDLKSSRQVSYEQWKNRSPYERALEWLGALWQRQQ
jgi:cardiolipin synthase